MLQIASRTEEKLQIMCLSGEVDEGTCTRLADALEAGSKSLADHVLLDLHDLAYINRTGQRILLKYLSQLHRLGRKLIVCQVRQPVQYAFTETGMDKVMPILPTIQDAKAFARSQKYFFSFLFSFHPYAFFAGISAPENRSFIQ